MEFIFSYSNTGQNQCTELTDQNTESTYNLGQSAADFKSSQPTLTPVPSAEPPYHSNSYGNYNRYSTYNAANRTDKFINRNRTDRQLKYTLTSLKSPFVPSSYSSLTTSSPTPSVINNPGMVMNTPLKSICKPRSCSVASRNGPTHSKTVSELISFFLKIYFSITTIPCE